jgi:hypothetical protein
LAKNLDTSQGTFSCWVKPLNWEGHGKKFRHTLVVTAGPQYTMLVYLYPIGDKAVFNHIHVGAGTAAEATWRAGAPVDLFQRDQWTHLASTWDARAVRLYANGRRVGEGLVASPLPKREAGSIYICPIDFWKNKQWGDPAEQTVCDEVRIFGRALEDEEILDLYAADAPAGAPRPTPALVLEMRPQFDASAIALDVRPAHVDADTKARNCRRSCWKSPSRPRQPPTIASRSVDLGTAARSTNPSSCPMRGWAAKSVAFRGSWNPPPIGDGAKGSQP